MGIKINSVAGGSCGSIVPEQRGAASASDPCHVIHLMCTLQNTTGTSTVLVLVQY